ncbi:MAG: hypothetical protein IJK63_01260 [Oscillospiraceae bacterium]|nr:hypothetical protein [Oscillospiraceae bacterium]
MSKIMHFERCVMIWIQNTHLRNYQNRIARDSLKCHSTQSHITSDEKKEIEKVWGGLGFRGNVDWHCLYKTINGFDPFYVPTDIYGTEIIHRLNQQNLLAAWDEKAYYPRFFPEINKPRMIGLRIDGQFYDGDYKIVSPKVMERILLEEKRVIVKPSDGMEGRGIEIWDTNEVDLKKKLESYSSNFVIQEVLVQHDSLGSLNKSSINPIRVMTLRLNGKIKYLHSIVRFGTPGSITDVSFANGKELIQASSVSREGIINSSYFDADGIKRPRSKLMGGECKLQIPNFDKVIQMGMEIHNGLHHFDLVGSDITVDKNGTPIMIEYNVFWPGPIFPQYCNGPLFGEYSEELIETLKKRAKK